MRKKITPKNPPVLRTEKQLRNIRKGGMIMGAINDMHTTNITSKKDRRL